MRHRCLYLVALLGLCGGLGLLFAATVSAQTHVIYLTVDRVQPPLGPAVYDAYCASCHGTLGRGDGRVAADLRRPVANLTLIEARDGTFDQNHVVAHIRDGFGTNPMPVWHSHIRQLYGSEAAEQLVLRNVVVYLEGMQVKP